MLEDSETSVYNGLSEIYVNSAVDDGSEIADLMRVFIDDNYYNDQSFPCTSRLKRMLKTTEGGRTKMSSFIEKIREEGREEGRAEGLAEGDKKGRRSTINELQSVAPYIKEGKDDSFISEILQIPLETIRNYRSILSLML